MCLLFYCNFGKVPALWSILRKHNISKKTCLNVWDDSKRIIIFHYLANKIFRLFGNSVRATLISINLQDIVKISRLGNNIFDHKYVDKICQMNILDKIFQIRICGKIFLTKILLTNIHSGKLVKNMYAETYADGIYVDENIVAQIFTTNILSTK